MAVKQITLIIKDLDTQAHLMDTPMASDQVPAVGAKVKVGDTTMYVASSVTDLKGDCAVIEVSEQEIEVKNG